MSIKMNVTRFVSRQILKTQNASPQILFAAGVASMVGSTVLACKATLKVEDILDDHAKSSIQIDEAQSSANYTEEDYQKDQLTLKLRTGGKVVRLYGPALILGGVGIACLTKSHRIMSERNAALTAAYIAVDRAFREYRQQVIEDFGEEKDREYRFNKTITEVTDDKGKKRTVAKYDLGGDQHSLYSAMFDQLSPSWSDLPEYNITKLRGVEHQATHILRAKGHIFLNEVWDMLGISRTQIGNVAGWFYEDGGDDYVDLGVFGDDRDVIKDFMFGFEGGILLDPNVQGNILKKI